MMDEWRAGNGQKIKAMYAWVATEADGGEGVVAITLPGLGTTPLIGADMARMESFRAQAQAVSKSFNVPIALKKFSTVETLETHNP